MSRLPWFKLYPQAYDADTPDLTLEQDGLYSRMLRKAWYTSDDGCSLPADPKLLSRRLNVTQRTLDRLSIVINTYWVVEGDRLVSTRLRAEAIKSGNQSKSQSDRARNGWNTRNHGALPEESSGTGGASPGHSPGNASKKLDGEESKDQTKTSLGASTGSDAAAVPTAVNGGPAQHPTPVGRGAMRSENPEPPDPDAVHRLVAAGFDSLEAEDALRREAEARRRFGGQS